MGDNGNFLAPIITLVFGIVLSVVTGVMARVKGYKFLNWFFAGGLLGVIVLCFLPYANDPKLPEAERQHKIRRGNLIGRNIALTLVALAILSAVLNK